MTFDSRLLMRAIFPVSVEHMFRESHRTFIFCILRYGSVFIMLKCLRRFLFLFARSGHVYFAYSTSSSNKIGLRLD